jgi:predicted Fe-Mo cluster-binding NifX family protein
MGDNMKIAVSTEGENITSFIDQRFGRCNNFIIIDIKDKEIKEIKVLANTGAQQGHGAGIKAAELIAEQDVDVVITGELGPNAKSVLDKCSIDAYHAFGEVKEAISDFLDDKLERISQIAEPHNGDAKEKTETGSNGERIFFPLLNDAGLDSEISQHFGHAPYFGLYIVEEDKFEILDNNLNHTDPTKTPIDQIEEAVQPTTIFAKGIGARAIQLINEKGLRLKTGMYRTVREVIENLDELEEQTKSCGHEHNHH